MTTISSPSSTRHAAPRRRSNSPSPASRSTISFRRNEPPRTWTTGSFRCSSPRVARFTLDLLFANSNTGPYRLLGEGYFLPADVLADLEDWRRDGATGSMALDAAAFRRGYSLGVLNRYVQKRCPSSIREWVGEKRRQVAEPYRRLRAPNWSAFDRLRFVTGTGLTHLLAVTNVVGIPVGLVVALATVAGWLSLSPLLVALVACNAVVWAYYSVRSSRAAWQAVPFESRWARLRYSLLSNPFTQALYATLWAVPLALALRDAVTGDESSVSGTPTE